MTLEMGITLAILFAAIVLFITEWVRIDVVALGVVVALMLSDVLTIEQALAGFSSTAVLLIAALFIVGGAVFQTGLADILARQVLRLAGDSEIRLLTVIMVTVAVMSGFMSNTGTVAVLLPAVISLAASTKISPSRLLMPLAFASSLGGAATLIGTPPNIIVSKALADSGRAPFQFFSFAPMGILLIMLGIAFMLVVSRLIPDRRPAQDRSQASETASELIDNYALPERIFKLRIRKDSPFNKMRLAVTGIGRDYDINVLEISRPAPPRTLATLGAQELVMQSKRNIPVHPRPETLLQHNDILIVQGETRSVSRLAINKHLAIQPRSQHDKDVLLSDEVGVVEVVLPPRSRLIGKSITEIDFGKKYRLSVLSLNRPGVATDKAYKDIPLQSGDILLLQGEWRDMFELRRQPRDFVLIGGTGEIESHLHNREKAPLTLLILLGMLVVLVTGLLPATTAAMLASLLIVLTGCLTMDEAYEAIDWKSVVLIAGMLPMSTALSEVGLVDVVANGMTATLGNLGPLAVMAGLFLLTAVFTQILSNTATSVIVAPLALATAESLQVMPHAFLMSIAVAASMAFASPIASPVNTLVMGAGHYRFGDYVRVGVPLILLTFVASMLVLPLLFPFQP